MTDPYLQTNGTLRNKLGITDPDELSRVETRFTAYRVATLARADHLPVAFDLSRLKATHRYLFQDLYSWAGEVRTTDLFKADTVGGSLHAFIPAAAIPATAEGIFTRLEQQHELHGLERDRFVVEVSRLFADKDGVKGPAPVTQHPKKGLHS